VTVGEVKRVKTIKEVSKQARDIEKIHTWHDGTVVESMADFARDQVHAIYMLAEFAA